MKKASMILGIVGGALTLVAVYFSMVIDSQLNAVFNMVLEKPAPAEPVLSIDWQMVAIGLVITVLGIVGGLMVRKHRIAAGIMFIIAAVSSVILFSELFGALFAIAAVFALIKEKPKRVDASERVSPQ